MRKILSIALAVILIFSFAPGALAAEISKEQRYARSTLSGNELEFYDDTYAAIKQGHGVNPTDYGISKNKSYVLCDFVYNDSPELIDKFSVYGSSEENKMLDELERAASGIINEQTNSEMSDYNKIKSLYFYLGGNIDFDYASEEAINKNKSFTESMNNSQSAYGGIVSKKAVCAGISASFQYLLYKIGIPCYIVTGTIDNKSHAWNIYQVDGEWYYCDLTLDLKNIKSADAALFFMKDDSFNEYHKADKNMNPELPACTSQKYMDGIITSQPQASFSAYSTQTIAPAVTPQTSVMPVSTAQVPEAPPAVVKPAFSINWLAVWLIFAGALGGTTALVIIRKKKQRL